MNKRQAKKMRNKVVYPLVDEMNLLTLSEEERKAAFKDFEGYVQKHFRYFHYRDMYKLIRKPCLYAFPIGSNVSAEAKQYVLDMMRRVRTNHPTRVSQECAGLVGVIEIKER